jgi:membrane-associated phospholipid phosphatase
MLAALVVAALGGLYSAGVTLGSFDGQALPLAALRPPWLGVAWTINFTGGPVGAAALLTALVVGCLLLRRPRTAVLAVAGPGAAVAATRLLKPVVGRTIHGDWLAYPSGHTALATAVAVVLALLIIDLLRPARPAATLLVLTAAGTAGAAMGWAQTVLSYHYATDTVGGFCTALAIVPAAAWSIDRLADRSRGNERSPRPD